MSKSFQLSINKIKKSGAKIIEIDLTEINRATKLAGKLFPYEAYNNWKEKIEANPELMYPPVLSRFRGGMNITDEEYLDSWQELKNIRKSFIFRINKCDAVIAPTCPITPPLVQKLLDCDKFFTESNLLALRNTRVGNLLGLTAISIPTQIDFCGLMLLSKPNTENSLLKSAYLLERCLNNKT